MEATLYLSTKQSKTRRIRFSPEHVLISNCSLNFQWLLNVQTFFFVYNLNKGLKEIQLLLRQPFHTLSSNQESLTALIAQRNLINFIAECHANSILSGKAPIFDTSLFSSNLLFSPSVIRGTSNFEAYSTLVSDYNSHQSFYQTLIFLSFKINALIAFLETKDEEKFLELCAYILTNVSELSYACNFVSSFVQPIWNIYSLRGTLGKKCFFKIKNKFFAQ